MCSRPQPVTLTLQPRPLGASSYPYSYPDLRRLPCSYLAPTLLLPRAFTVPDLLWLHLLTSGSYRAVLLAESSAERRWRAAETSERLQARALTMALTPTLILTSTPTLILTPAPALILTPSQPQP